MSKIRIVLADNNAQVLRYVSEFLSTNGYEIVAAVSDGIAAVNAAVRLHPDIVVLDVSMPNGNGIRAAATLRETGIPAKVIFLTVHQDRETCRAALETGASAFVVKSRMASDLMPAIQSALEGRRFISPGCE